MNDFDRVVEQVDRRIAEKRTKLKELLLDPDLAPYVAALKNGHQIPVKAHAPSHGPKDRPGVREAIKKLLHDQSHAFWQVRQFSRDDVKQHLDDLYGYDAYALKSIGDALHHLSTSKNKAIKKVSGGEGGKPNRYERVA